MSRFDPVGCAEIAHRLGVQANTVHPPPRCRECGGPFSVGGAIRHHQSECSRHNPPTGGAPNTSGHDERSESPGDSRGTLNNHREEGR